MITYEQIQAKIADAISNSKEKQKVIAEAIGVKQSQISCYLNKKKAPALDTLANLCAFLELDPADILCLDEFNKKQ